LRGCTVDADADASSNTNVTLQQLQKQELEQVELTAALKKLIEAKLTAAQAQTQAEKKDAGSSHEKAAEMEALADFFAEELLMPSFERWC
jgi:hypothetical protein